VLAVADYGPFGPAVGYGGAIVAAGGAFFAMWGGRTKKWRPPDEDLPGTAQKLVVLLCGVFMVVEWYVATPAIALAMIWVVVVLAVSCVVCFLRYSGLIGTYVYIRKVAGKNQTIKEERILGGRRLLPNAEKTRTECNIDTQILFEGAAYRPDLLWDRADRQWVKTRVLLFFILTLVLGTSALTSASFATQVVLTKKAAASVLHSSDTPGLLQRWSKKPTLDPSWGSFFTPGVLFFHSIKLI
jgi:hypothetical protein